MKCPPRKLVPTVAPILNFEAYVEKHLDQRRDPRIADPYLAAVDEVLPEPFRWGNVGSGTVSNTRVFKCSTKSVDGVKSRILRACAEKFVAQELRLLRPRIILAMGAAGWPHILPHFGVQCPAGPGPHSCSGEFDGMAIPIVACFHLSGQNPIGKRPTYRATVRACLSQAATLAGIGRSAGAATEQLRGENRAPLGRLVVRRAPSSK